MKINKQYLLDKKKMDAMLLSKMTPKYIAIHNTANTASARNEALNVYNNNWKKGTNGVSFHFAVDESEVYQILRADYNGWHASDGAGPGNMQSIAIEIARSKDYSTDNYAKAEENAVKLTAMLMKQFNIPLANVKRHYDFDTRWRKQCPHRMFEANSWGSFKARVAAEYSGTTAPKPQPKPPVKPKPAPTGNKYKKGDVVKFNRLSTQSVGGTIVNAAVKQGAITKVVAGATYPYLIGNGIGWVNDSMISGKVSAAKPSKPKQKWLKIFTNVSSYAYYKPSTPDYLKTPANAWGTLKPIAYKNEAPYIEYRVIAESGNFKTILLHGSPKNPQISIYTGPGTSHAWEIYYK